MLPETTQNTKLETAAAILREINKPFATTGDVAKVFQAIVSFFQKRETEIAAKVDEQAAQNALVSRRTDAVRRDLEAHALSNDKQIAQATKTSADNLKAALANLERRLKGIETAASDQSYTDSALAELENGLKALISDPETPESIRNKLESLQGASKLSIDAIFGLQEALDELKKQVAVIADRPSGAQTVIAYSRGQIKLYDLSDKLDGSRKTFALPAFWRILTVQSTSFPNAFRPNVDYTVDGNAMSITFTDEIDATSTLAEGQTLTILYAEP